MAFGLGARAWLAAALASGLVATAAAQEGTGASEAPSAAGPQSGWYVSGGVGLSEYRMPPQAGTDHHYETVTSHGGKLMLGYEVRRWLRIEAGAVKLGSDWKTDAAVTVLGVWHLSDRFALLGSIGGYDRHTERYDSDFFSTRTTRSDNRVEWTYGFGAEWSLQDRVSVLLQVESFEGRPLDSLFNDTRGAEMATLSLRYRF